MRVLWEILLISQVICVWVLFPILIVYYESNESDGLNKKIKRSMQVAIPLFLFLVLVTVPTYFWLRDVRSFSEIYSFF
jgi:Kef-type K+ transport system membrane component KefB